MKVRPIVAVLAMSSLTLVRGDARAGGGGLDVRVAQFLDAPQRALRPVPKGFRIIALSNLSEYCASSRSRPCLERLVELARSRDVAPPDGEENGLYDSHLNIVLGSYERVARDGKYRALNTKISKSLARKIMASKNAHIASYAGTSARWPADQAATLYSLHLHDRNFGETIAAAPIAAWLAWSKKSGLDRKWSLPRSEITGKYKTSNMPRGCALSFTVRYIAPFAPEEARAIWERYKDVFAVDYGVVFGFREWPPGIERGADVDSGPIVNGIGTAASGLAIGAARAVGDDLTFTRLVASAEIAKTFVPDLGILALSIELAGRAL